MRRLPLWIDRMGAGIVSFTNCISEAGPYTRADIDYDRLSKSAAGYDRVVALGNFPSSALKKLNIDHFVLPHPSGLNRKLNDPKFELEQLELCRNYIHG
jgi:hypothetical protein